MSNFLSTKNIDPKQRLIFALDVENNTKAKQLVEHLGDSVGFYKIGLQLFMGDNYLELAQWLVAQGKQVFADLKFFDVPQTVKLAVRGLKTSGATFATVHGNDKMLEAAVAESGNMGILAVTALTSLDAGDIKDLGFKVDIAKIVLSRAKRAVALGCAGVISSGLEVKALRTENGSAFVVITPGIRPVANDDDQKRTVNVKQAFANGADYIVVGRPIKDHHGFATPKQAATNIQQQILEIFN